MRSIQEVQEAHAPALVQIPGVVAVYIGALEDGTPCIRVAVTERRREIEAKIPARLEGYPVVVEESDEFRPLPGKKR